ncbi:MAG: NADH-quinone oxidoreductase subunit NuoE [Dehalococcoidales bacterium]|nr:NADH-quinone oxidoreductase subunit NuoE [Dehalococcoidales bacterium]
MNMAGTNQKIKSGVQVDNAFVEKQVEEILTSYRGEKAELIPILQQVQQKFGFLPEAAMSKLANFLRIPECTVFGVATFYAQFKLVPTGRNIVRVCRGTACHVRGGALILREVEKRLGIKDGQSTPDLEYALETVACIGACAMAPNMTINNETYGNLTTKKVAEILDERDSKK